MPSPFEALIAGAEEMVDGTPELLDGIRKLTALARSDPEAGLFRVRKMLEYLLRDLLARKCDESPGTSTLESLIQRLLKKEILTKKLVASANYIRELGNLGVHGFAERIEFKDVEESFEHLVPILEWYREQLEPAPVASAEPIAPPSPPRPRPRPRMRVAWAGTLAVALVVPAGAWWARRSTAPTGPATVSIPEWAAGLPVASALRIVYQTQAPALDRGRIAQVVISLNAHREDEANTHPLEDGETLSSADDYYLEMEVTSGGYLYVFQVDSLGKLTALHPAIPSSKYSSGANPVPAGGRVRIPSQSENLRLDENIGIEHIYFVLNADPWPALEGSVARLDASMTDPESTARKIERPMHLALRGVGGTTKATGPGTAHSAERPAVTQTRYRGEGPMLVVERWFRHGPRPRPAPP
jgi:hypothetical protein